MKKYLWLFLVLASAALAGNAAAGENARGALTESGGTRAAIETAYGTIMIRLFPEAAPKHVENFIRLAKEGFYDGTIFHGAVKGTMIQGGDPYTKASRGTYTGCCPDKRKYGMGGPGWTVTAEFNAIAHKRGTVSMVRFKGAESSGSQFFILLKDSPSLDGRYTAFGEVISGIEVADRIAGLPKNRELPYLPEERVEIKVRAME